MHVVHGVNLFLKAQQDVPAWLEEIAFSTYVPGFSGGPRDSVFASVDTRKVGRGAAQNLALVPVEAP